MGSALFNLPLPNVATITGTTHMISTTPQKPRMISSISTIGQQRSSLTSETTGSFDATTADGSIQGTIHEDEDNSNDLIPLTSSSGVNHQHQPDGGTMGQNNLPSTSTSSTFCNNFDDSISVDRMSVASYSESSATTPRSATSVSDRMSSTGPASSNITPTSADAPSFALDASLLTGNGQSGK